MRFLPRDFRKKILRGLSRAQINPDFASGLFFIGRKFHFASLVEFSDFVIPALVKWRDEESGKGDKQREIEKE